MEQWHVFEAAPIGPLGPVLFVSKSADGHIAGVRRVATCSTEEGAKAQKSALKQLSMERRNEHSSCERNRD